ncbi:MAG: hypothetical protein J6S50_05685 [Oscillospiraceae bacterium]|nr:hypothetical protein [Oscillospiraceae bacterium]
MDWEKLKRAVDDAHDEITEVLDHLLMMLTNDDRYSREDCAVYLEDFLREF